MTDKEIRLELAKAALIGGASRERTEEMLSWVIGEARRSGEVDLDKVKVSELEQYLGMSSVRFRNRCMENDIHTVGQLIRIGGRNFRSLRLVGDGLVSKLRSVLQDNYGVSEW